MGKEELVCGDIIVNNHAGGRNKYLIYLRNGTIRQGRYKHRSYDCLSCDGKTVQLFKDTADIEKIGHMKEFDAFVLALKGLEIMGEQNGKMEGETNEPDKEIDHG